MDAVEGTHCGDGRQYQLQSPDALREILTNAGFDPEQVADAMAQPQIKTALIEATDAAAKRGVFGAPTFFVNNEMFFGQDRMDWVKRALG